MAISLLRWRHLLRWIFQVQKNVDKKFNIVSTWPVNSIERIHSILRWFDSDFIEKTNNSNQFKLNKFDWFRQQILSKTQNRSKPTHDHPMFTIFVVYIISAYKFISSWHQWYFFFWKGKHIIINGYSITNGDFWVNNWAIALTHCSTHTRTCFPYQNRIHLSLLYIYCL